MRTRSTTRSSRAAALGLAGWSLLLALLAAQAWLPIAQVGHLDTESEARSTQHAADQTSPANPLSPAPQSPAAPHDEAGCSICQMIAAARQGLSVPPPLAIPVLHRTPETRVPLPVPALPE